MAILGTRHVTIPKHSGAFNCPECGGTEYLAQSVRRFMTLTKIPVLPLSRHGQYIECQLCRATFDDAVLRSEQHPSAIPVQAHFSDAIKRVMILMMLADGKIKLEERKAIQHIFHALTGHLLSDEDIRKEVILTRANEQSMDSFLHGLLGCLNVDGKLLVLQAAYAIAESDGEFAPRERTFLYSLGDRLELDPQIVQGLLNANPVDA